MAKSSIQVVEILRNTADRLSRSNQYQWGHMGLCNCGFLAQEITHLRKEEIHARAMMNSGDWSEQLNDYCPTSGLPMDRLIGELLAVGFSIDDLKHLERLSSPIVLREIDMEKRNLRWNVKPDVVYYLETWADVLENKLLSSIDLSQLANASATAGASNVPKMQAQDVYLSALHFHWASEKANNPLVHSLD